VRSRAARRRGRRPQSEELAAVREGLPPARRRAAVYWLAVMLRRSEGAGGREADVVPLAETGGESWPR
jgi:hypothetical protein